MSTYILRRLIGAIPLLLFISVISYAMMALSPGGPSAILTHQARHMTAAAQHAFMVSLGLDKPWYVQYFYWLTNIVVHGSLGFSFVDHRPVITKVLERLPVTLALIGSSFFLTLIIAIPVGVIAALRRNSLFDHVSMLLTFVFYGIPTFWLAIFLIDVFSIQLHWFPSSGLNSIGREGEFFDSARHLFLPAVALTIPALAGWVRYQRGAMIDVLDESYLRTARSKGLPERVVIVKHALRNALMPIVTLLGLSLPGLVGGAYFVEYIFSIPGMGFLGLNTIFQRDYPTLMAITMLSAVLVVLGNLLADVLYALVDPRLAMNDPAFEPIDVTVPPSTSRVVAGFAQKLVGERAGFFGVVIVVVLVLSALFGPLFIHYSPIAINHALIGFPQGPSFAHPLGTDVIGRDELTRLLYGARVSLFVGLTAMLIGISIGTLYGAISATAGGRIDAVMMRFVDALLSFPTFFLILTVEALKSDFSLPIVVAIIGLLSWMGVARLVRAEVLTLREREFISAAIALGSSSPRLIFRHLIPNALGPVLVAASFAVGDNILTEASLSYLGLGVQAPTPSWGNMLQDALDPSVRNDWWLVISPGACIVITLLGFSLLGERIRVILNPQIK